MANLAIKGHPTRGKEVIEILEMLGGTNVYHHRGGDNCVGYTVEGNEIRNIHYIFGDEDFIFLSLEEFLEKFPYKIGDRVRVAEYESKVRIDDMKWDGNEIQYEVFTDMTEWYSAEELNRFNEPLNISINEPLKIPKVKNTTLKYFVEDKFIGNINHVEMYEIITNVIEHISKTNDISILDKFYFIGHEDSNLNMGNEIKITVDKHGNLSNSPYEINHNRRNMLKILSITKRI